MPGSINPPFLSRQEAKARSFDAVQNGFRQASADTAIKGTQVTVTTTAAALLTPQAARQVLLIGVGATDIFIGPTAGVTAANGFLVRANTTLTLEIGPNVATYAVTAAGTSACKLLEAA